MLIQFDGKTVIVAGAAHGIGRAIARAFANDGASVLACDRLVQEMFRRFFSGIVRRIEEPLSGRFLPGHSGFDKDLGVCAQRLVPCGAQLLDPNLIGARRRRLLPGLYNQLVIPFRFSHVIHRFRSAQPALRVKPHYLLAVRPQ